MGDSPESCSHCEKKETVEPVKKQKQPEVREVSTVDACVGVCGGKDFWKRFWK